MHDFNILIAHFLSVSCTKIRTLVITLIILRCIKTVSTSICYLVIWCLPTRTSGASAPVRSTLGLACDSYHPRVWSNDMKRQRQFWSASKIKSSTTWGPVPPRIHTAQTFCQTTGRFERLVHRVNARDQNVTTGTRHVFVKWKQTTNIRRFIRFAVELYPRLTKSIFQLKRTPSNRNAFVFFFNQSTVNDSETETKSKAYGSGTVTRVNYVNLNWTRRFTITLLTSTAHKKQIKY